MKLIRTKNYNTKHNLVENVFHRELCKNLDFDYTNSKYMNNPDVTIRTKCQIVDFVIQANRRVKIKESGKESYISSFC